MKFFAFTLFLVGFASTLTGGVVGEVRTFSRNLKKDGFIADFVISGLIVEEGHITPTGLTRAYSLDLKAVPEEDLSDIRVFIQQGEEGSSTYFQVELLSAPHVNGEVSLPRLQVGTKDFSAMITVSAVRRRGDTITHIFRCSVSLQTLLNSGASPLRF